MKLRVFYKPSNNEIVWNCTLEGTTWPYSVADYVAMTPQIQPNDYACIEVTDQVIIDAYLASDTNKIVNGKLVTGTPRVIPPLTFADLPHSTVSAVIKSIASDKKSCVVTRIYQGNNYDGIANVTFAVQDRLGKNNGINVGDTVLLTYAEHSPQGMLPIVVDEIAAIAPL